MFNDDFMNISLNKFCPYYLNSCENFNRRFLFLKVKFIDLVVMD